MQCVGAITLDLGGTPVSVLVPGSTPCTGYLLTSAEIEALRSDALSLPADQGALLASSIIGVWAVAFIVRTLIRTIGSGSPGD